MDQSDSDYERPDEPRTLYEVLGVDEYVGTHDLTKAYRQRALEEHPDKGGDAAAFDDLVKAFKVISVQESRDAYDQDLARNRERSKLVEGGRKYDAGVAAKAGGSKQAEAPMPRQKTEPNPSSKRQGNMRTFQPGKMGHCANEWKGMTSGTHFLKMITDEVTPVEVAERLFQQYAKLPPGKEKKRDWTNGLRGEEKQALKLLAKKKEEAGRAKMKAWLSHGPSGAPVRRQLNKEATKAKEAKDTKKAKATVASTEEDESEPDESLLAAAAAA